MEKLPELVTPPQLGHERTEAERGDSPTGVSSAFFPGVRGGVAALRPLEQVLIRAVTRRPEAAGESRAAWGQAPGCPGFPAGLARATRETSARSGLHRASGWV